jgi:hypothetical protein
MLDNLPGRDFDTELRLYLAARRAMDISDETFSEEASRRIGDLYENATIQLLRAQPSTLGHALALLEIAHSRLYGRNHGLDADQLPCPHIQPDDALAGDWDLADRALLEAGIRALRAISER